MSMIKCKETGGEIKEKIYRFVYFVLTFALGGYNLLHIVFWERSTHNLKECGEKRAREESGNRTKRMLRKLTCEQLL